MNLSEANHYYEELAPGKECKRSCIKESTCFDWSGESSNHTLQLASQIPNNIPPNGIPNNHTCPIEFWNRLAEKGRSNRFYGLIPVVDSEKPILCPLLQKQIDVHEITNVLKSIYNYYRFVYLFVRSNQRRYCRLSIKEFLNEDYVNIFKNWKIHRSKDVVAILTKTKQRRFCEKK